MGTHLEAYESVLRRVGKPLHVKEIVEIARAVGLLQTGGLTPVATARSLIPAEMRKNGSRSTFVKVGPAVFGLRSQMQAGSGHQKRRGQTGSGHQKRRGQTGSGARSGKAKIASGRIAVAGRHRVVSELVLSGYEADMVDERGAAHILARKDGSVFSIRVMVASRHPGGAYIRTIKKGLVDGGSERDRLYTFLLLESRGKDDDFVTLPFSTISALIHRGRITKNKAGYQVRLATADAGATINGADVSDCLNNWDLDHLARRPAA